MITDGLTKSLGPIKHLSLTKEAKAAKDAKQK